MKQEETLTLDRQEKFTKEEMKGRSDRVMGKVMNEDHHLTPFQHSAHKNFLYNFFQNLTVG
ncbi:MAG: hypothetical protein GWP36_02700 [Bacteroidetes bacterium]|nr:hypothetical protein [Bacteroidota bacterium]